MIKRTHTRIFYLGIFILFTLLPVVAYGISLTMKSDPLQERLPKCRSHSVDFLKTTDLDSIGRVSQYTNAYLSTPLIQTQTNICSSTVISQSGHILTAAHCFDQCLHSTGIMKTQEILPPVGETVFSASVRQRTKPSAVCEFKVDGRIVKGTVMVLPDCYLQAKDAAWRPLLNGAEPRESACKSIGDFLIFKVPELAAHSCVSASQAQRTPRGTLWGMGFPMEVNRTIETAGTNGRDKYVSAGSLNLTSSCVKDPDGRVSLPTVRALPTIPVGTSRITLDAAPGNSGTGVLDSRSELVGMIFMVQNLEVERQECLGSTVMFDIKTIRSAALAQVGEQVYQEIFDCPKPTLPGDLEL